MHIVVVPIDMVTISMPGPDLHPRLLGGRLGQDPI